MIYDTNFLIALQGRHKRFTRSEAKAWIAENETGALYVPRAVAVEFAAGFATDVAAASLLDLFVVLPTEDPVWSETVEVMCELCAAGQGIGLADSVIAATARLYGLPLVTDNTKHFRRIPGLILRNYVS